MTKLTIGAQADKLRAIYLKKKAAEEVVKGLGEEYDREALVLIELADEQKTTTGKGAIASFSIGDSVVPQVKDWDAFYKYIKKSGFIHLLERRPSVTGCRELFDTKGAIPGVEKFTKRKINLRGVE